MHAVYPNSFVVFRKCSKRPMNLVLPTPPKYLQYDLYNWLHILAKRLVLESEAFFERSTQKHHFEDVTVQNKQIRFLGCCSCLRGKKYTICSAQSAPYPCCPIIRTVHKSMRLNKNKRCPRTSRSHPGEFKVLLSVDRIHREVALQEVVAGGSSSCKASSNTGSACMESSPFSGVSSSRWSIIVT